MGGPLGSILTSSSSSGAISLSTDSGASDAFGRLRTSEPLSLFSSSLVYDTQTLLWENATVGTGGVAHDADTSTVALTVDVTSDEATRQSRQWTQYRPGKSLLVALTFNFNLDSLNVLKQVGYGDGVNDGIMLEAIDGLVYITRYSTDSGATQVLQTAWNVDTFDGTGPSKIKLDWTKSQILMIDFQWLGVGRVRVGFDVDGIFYPAHEFLHANSVTTTYMRTASLPVRYHIETTDAVAATSTLTQICSTVVSEGGFDFGAGIPRSAGNGITGIGVTTRRPIFSIRPKLTYNSVTNRAGIFPLEVELSAVTNTAYWELVYNGTLTTPSWTSVSDTSHVEKDVASTTIANGEVIASGFVVPGVGSARLSVQSPLSFKIPLSLNIAGDAGTALSVVCTSFTGTSTVNAALDWIEFPG